MQEAITVSGGCRKAASLFFDFFVLDSPLASNFGNALESITVSSLFTLPDAGVAQRQSS
jgi:hypothetical protein